MELEKFFSKLASPANSGSLDEEECEKISERNKRLFLISNVYMLYSLFFPISHLPEDKTISISTTYYIILLCLSVLLGKLGFKSLDKLILLLTAIYTPLQFHFENLYGLTALRQPFILAFGYYTITRNGRLFCLEMLLEIIYFFTLHTKSLEQTLHRAIINENKELFSSIQREVLATLIFLVLTFAFLHRDYKLLNEHYITNENLRNKSERQKTFILGISHEIRNLVNSITGSINLCLLEECTKTVRENLKNAQLSGELLIKEINNVLDSGKIELGELEINKKPSLIAEFFPKYWRIYTEIISRKRLGGTLFISRSIPSTLLIDEFRLSQILLNLVGNSTKFTEKGSINITVDWLRDVANIDDEVFKPNPYDEEGLFEKDQAMARFNNSYDIHEIDKASTVHPENIGYKPGDFGVLRIAVRDTGCGIDSKDLDKLFNKFSQVGAKSTRKIGSGLGLFICKQLSQKMNGDIRIFSKKGVGTTLILVIPCEIPGNYVQTINELQEESNTTERKLRTMIVDDVDMNVGILAQFMKKLSYPVTETAVNGLQAYEKYIHHYKNNNPITFITMDINMPVMDGMCSVQKIREYEVENHIEPCVIVMVSANCAHTEIYHCTNPKGKIRADGFLSKPVSLEDLRTFISTKLPNSIKL